MDEFFMVTAPRVTTKILITNADMDEKMTCYSKK